MSWLTSLVDANALGGWVRAAAASGITALLIKYPVLSPFVDPTAQASIAAAAAAVVTGAWSHVAKSMTPAK